ncbi:MAG: HAD family hydrolase [Caldilineaceae bacterium]
MCSVVLWDVGGTLVEDAVSLEVFVHRCLASAGIPLTALLASSVRAADEVLRRQAQGPLWRTPDDEQAGDFAFAVALLRGSGAADAQVQQVAAALGHYFDRYRLVPGIRALLSELRDASIRQGVVSNWPPSLKAFLDHHELSQYFSVVVGSGECGVAKPDPAIFLKALAELGVSPSDGVYVGDNPEYDIRPAEMLGLRVLHFDPRGRWHDAQIRDVSTLRGQLLQRLGLA